MDRPSEAERLLAGAFVQRADVGERSLVLKVRRPGETAFVVAIAQRGVGVTGERPAKPAGARSMPRLEGFRIAWIARGAVALERLREGAEEVETAWVEVEPARVKVRVGGPATEAPEAFAREDERAAWEARGQALAEATARDAVDARRTDALRAVKRGIQRVLRRAEAVRADLARIDQARAVAAQLPWLVAEAAKVPRGARSLQVTDWSSGEPKVIEVPLDPAKPARAQVEAMFARAKRLHHGAAVAATRLADAEATLARLQPITTELEAAKDPGVIDDALVRARAAAPRDVKLDVASPGGKREPQAKAPPYRTFHSRDAGARILVGRGGAHNDVLTFQVARPHDLWLHAKDLPGAHVVVPLPKGRSCPAELLVDAAHLAAHFSDARDEAVVDVQYAQRRHLRKPKGSAPGLVVVDREKVLAVRVARDALRALLESEEAL